MKNFKKLSREELKNTFGGKRSCKLVVPNGSGGYNTISGTCDSQLQTVVVANGGQAEFGLAMVSFCNTGDGVAHSLSSNGGNSNC